MAATTLEAISSGQIRMYVLQSLYLYHPNLKVTAALQACHNASLDILNPSLRLFMTSHYGQTQQDKKKCATYQSCQPDIGCRLAILKPAVQTPRLSINASTERQRDRWRYARMREGFIWE
jgi:hypothetical protein